MAKKTTKSTTKKSKTTSTTSTTAAQTREAMNKFKFEVANEIGVPLKQGYNGDLTSAQNGYVGGYMVKKMLEKQKANLK